MPRTVQLSLLLAAAALPGGCGDDNAERPATRARATGTVPTAPRAEARPALHAPRLLEMEWLGADMGTSDRVS